MIILLCNPTLHMYSYIFNRVEIRGIGQVLMASHSKLFFDNGRDDRSVAIVSLEHATNKVDFPDCERVLNTGRMD